MCEWDLKRNTEYKQAVADSANEVWEVWQLDKKMKRNAMQEVRMKAIEYCAVAKTNTETSQRHGEMPMLVGTTGSWVITTGKAVDSTQIWFWLGPDILFLRIAASILLNLITQQTHLDLHHKQQIKKSDIFKLKKPALAYQSTGSL